MKFAGTGWIQVTGRYNHQKFSDYLQKKGEFDPKIMEVGKTHTSEKYPWSISGNWWDLNGMNAYTNGDPPIDRVGQRVNGKYLPNGYQARREYSQVAFRVLGIPLSRQLIISCSCSNALVNGSTVCNSWSSRPLNSYWVAFL